MECFIYCRISEDRTGAGLGVSRQEAECRELADRLGWTVADVFTDNDISAYSGKHRPGYRKLLDRLSQGEVGGVIAWHTDRLHRSPVELEEYVEVCDRHGVTTQTVKAGPLDLATPSGRLVARQLGAVARFEVEHQIERAKTRRLQKVRAGEWGGGRRPYGYEADGVTVRPSEAEVIGWATAEILAGRSLAALSRELNEAGRLTSTGGAWDGTALKRVLLRPRNAGKITHNGDIVGDAEWPAVVDPETWLACRAVLTDPKRRSNWRGPGRRYVGGGLYECGVCGATLSTKIDKRRRCYECPEGHVVRDGDNLDAYIAAIVIERLSQPDAAELMKVEAEDTSELHVEAQGIRERLDELARLYAEGSVTSAQLAEGTAALREREAAIESRLSAVAERNTLAKFGQRDPAEVWESLDVEQRRAVIDVLMTVKVSPARRGRIPGWKPGEPYFDPESITIEWRSS